jgi:hypothetical protein
MAPDAIVIIHMHINHSRFIPGGVAEAAQIFLQDTHVLQKLLSYTAEITKLYYTKMIKLYIKLRNTAEVTGGKPIAV